MIGKTLLHYKLNEKLGEGGMGLVFKALDTKLDRTVAIKFLSRYIAVNPEQRERFKVEAKSAAALNHPNIAIIHAIEEEKLFDEDTLTFIVMEFIDGYELKSRIGNGSIPVEEALSYALQIAQGLQAAHCKGIIHRDIKSSNVMINKEGHIKVMDFGLAKISDGAVITKTGTLLGTIAYMSPEQAQEAEVDKRTDIWSFGVLLYEMLSGKRPFTGAYEHSIVYSIINDQHAPISSLVKNLPVGLEPLVDKVLEKDLDKRYQSFDELIDDLQDIIKMNELNVHTQRSSSGRITDSKFSKTANAQKSIERSEGERRNLTTVVCSFETVSEEDEELELEDVSELLPNCFEICNKVIDRYDGFVYNTSTLELTIIFGYPTAHEDGAKRAVLTALAILEGIKSFSKTTVKEKGISVGVKLTVDTGLVMIKSSMSKSKGDSLDILGDSLLRASKMQNIAKKNSILVANDTYKLIEGFFEGKEFGEYSLSRKDKLTQVFQILHQSQARGRLEASLVSGLTPLTGRQKEFDLLTSLWENATESIGQVIMLQGEAGIGKSRLVQEIKTHVAQNPQAWLIECFCSPYFQSSSLQPFIELFERNILEFKAGISPTEKLKSVEGFLVQYGFSLPDTIPIFCSLLSIPLSENYKPLPLTPEALKQKIIETLINLLLKRAAEQPILFIVDDLQWADPTTIELLGHVIEHIQAAGVLLLLTYRPTFKEPWDTSTHMTKISLNRLPHKEIDGMVTKITGGKILPTEVLEEIKTKTDGVPLFVEELTKMVVNSNLLIEKGDHFELKSELKALQIPATLKDSLMARLDKMGTAKEVAQLGATIGREFSYDMIKAISSLDDDKLKSELDKLIKAEILYRKGFVGQENYIFKHALIQDTAYQSLLKKQRQEIHKNIANVLDEQFSSLNETQPELFAHHYTAAGIYEQAINYWQKAGINSFQKSANIEAISHLQKGISLLSKLENDEVKNKYELTLLSILGPATIAIKGFGAKEVGEIFNRSSFLCESIGETPLLFPSIWGQWVYNLVRSNLEKAEYLSGEMIEIGEKYNNSSMLIEGYWTRGDNLFWLGDFENAKKYLGKAIGMYKPEEHHKNAYMFGQDPVVAAHCYLSYANWYLGFPDEALKNTEEALRIANELNHPFSIGWALAFRMMVAGFRRDAQLTLETSKATIEYCTKQAYPFWITSSQIMNGWAECALGNLEEGLKLMETGLAGFGYIGSIAVYPLFQGLLAEMQSKAGRNDDALINIDEAIKLAVSNKEVASEIDLYRIKANILINNSQDNNKESETLLRKSFELADKLNAKSRTLQAAIDLSELLINNGNSKNAKQILEDVTSSFTEGFNTKDYLKAMELISKL